MKTAMIRGSKMNDWLSKLLCLRNYQGLRHESIRRKSLNVSFVFMALLLPLGLAWGLAGHDSLPPSVRWYLEQREEHERSGQIKPFEAHATAPDSQNVRLVGKWGRGPASWLTGRDSLVFMSLGSEVAVFSAPDGNHVRVLSEIQCHEMTGRLCLRDSLLFIGCNGPLEVYNVADPSHPVFVNRVPAAVGAAISVVDTLAYVLGVDSLKIFNIANPRDFRFVGACQDSGYNMCVSNGFVYLCDRWGLYIIDATDPSHPHRATTLTGAQTGAAVVDSGYCYYATLSASPAALVIADVRDPYHPVEVGRKNGIGGYDIYKLGMFVYLPGYNIVDVSRRNSPTVIGSLGYGGNGVWTSSPYGYSFLGASSDGLGVIDINDPVHPFLDTMVAGADVSNDVCASGGFAYVSNDYAGMKILNMTDPTTPFQVGSYDTIRDAPKAQAVACCDSFAYLMTLNWSATDFRVVDVSNSDDPTLAATCGVYNAGEAIVILDSWAYVAEDYELEIYSIADPRNPRLEGSCGLPNSSYGLCVRDSLAFVANLHSVQIVNVARPASPSVIGSCNISALGVFVCDTLAFVAGYQDGLYVFSVANPRSPRLISNFHFSDFCGDVTVQGSLAYVGGYQFHVIDVSDLSSMHEVGCYSTPFEVKRLFRSDPYIYAACYDAGVCILETTSMTGLAERRRAKEEPAVASLFPNPAHNRLRLSIGGGGSNSLSCIKIRNVTGRVVLTLPYGSKTRKEVVNQEIDISSLPEGCYFVDLVPSSRANGLKFIKLE